jgi:thiamine biosynthesis protein ThiI
MAVLEQALAERVMLDISTLDQATEAAPVSLSIVSEVPPGSLVVDIRHPDEEERAPLRIPGVEVLHLPFYRLASDLARLQQDRACYLYCGKGVMSRLHAAHLQQQGWDKVGVYLPG